LSSRGRSRFTANNFSKNSKQEEYRYGITQ
jgi:hypothetical protein